MNEETQFQHAPALTMPPTVRRAIVPISFELFRGIGARPDEIVQVVSNDIPADARVVSSSYDIMTNRLLICLESPAFAETVEGRHLPWITGPTFRVIYPSPELLAAIKDYLNG